MVKLNEYCHLYIYIYIYIEKLWFSIQHPTLMVLCNLWRLISELWFSATYAVPSGLPDVLFTGSVDIILSTGLTQQVFGSLSTAIIMRSFHGN